MMIGAFVGFIVLGIVFLLGVKVTKRPSEQDAGMAVGMAFIAMCGFFVAFLREVFIWAFS